MTIEKASAGELVTKQIPDFNATLDNMKLNKWYEFGLEYHHGWYQFARTKAKQSFKVEVKRQDSKTYVRKVPTLASK